MFSNKILCDFWIMRILSCDESADLYLTSIGEAMSNSSPERNKAIVLEAFETLFNKRDYAAAERFWSPNYIQHSAHIAPGREGHSLPWSARARKRCATRTNSSLQKVITS